MNLTIKCENATVSTFKGYYYPLVEIELENVDKDFITDEVIKTIPIETYLAAVGLDSVLAHLKQYYVLNKDEITLEEVTPC